MGEREKTSLRPAFDANDLVALAAEEPGVAVSMFLPTHTRGTETRQDPIRLKNLIGDARRSLDERGVGRDGADVILGPAAALVEDHDFWQHQQDGLALFLEPGGARVHHVGVPLREQVTVAPTFTLRPMLPVVAADEPFFVLTLSANVVELFRGSRFGLTRISTGSLPRSTADLPGEADHENRVQASPVARPNAGSINAASAQVYGDSPAEWRKQRLVDFVRRTAAALEDDFADGLEPVVVVADTEIAGHLRKLAPLGSRLAAVVARNPEALSEEELHFAAYAEVEARLAAARAEMVGRLFSALARRDGRAAIDVHEVVRAAAQGRVDTLLVVEHDAVEVRDEDAADQFLSRSDGGAAVDVLETAVRCSLGQGGDVQLVERDVLPDGTPAAALLRY